MTTKNAAAPGDSPLQKAMVALDRMKAKLDAIERERSEPIAIIGMACRFPGGARTPEAFFDQLMEGRDAVTEVPPDRWSVDTTGLEPAFHGIRWGGFLEEVDRFDAAFFGISPP